MNQPKHHLKGILETTIGVLVLTPDSLLIRMIGTDDWTLLFWRGILSCLAILIFYFAFYRSQAPAKLKAIGLTGVAISLLYALSNILFVRSIRLTLVANTLIIVSAAPLLGALFSWVFLRERIRARTWVATLMGLGGILMIFAGGAGGGSLGGNLCAVGSACAIAATFVVIRHARAVNMVPCVALSGLFSALLISPLAAPLSVGGRDVLLLLLLGGIILPVSFALITLGPRYMSAPEVSLIMLLETVLGPVWVWMVLGETVPKVTLLGGLIVVGTLIGHSVLALREGGERGDGVVE